MTVITEDMLRVKRLKKELEDGMDFVFPVDSSLTPTARSYLREYRISSSFSSTSPLLSEVHSVRASSQKQEHLSKETIYRIQHLGHLLYLPFLTNEALSTEGWLYFGQQQQWLERFILEQPLVVEPVILESKVTILTNQQRQWCYSSKETQLQLDKIILQLEGESQLFGLFQAWATELVNTMAEISRNQEINRLDSMGEIIEEVVKRIQQRQQSTFEVEASGRHVRLSRQEIDVLFRPGYQLTKVKDLSQPGQFVCKEQITVAGSRELFQSVVILGPRRSESRVEVSMTDTRVLGINAPIRENDKTGGTPGVTLMNGPTVVILSHDLIVAKHHIRTTPEDALENKVNNSQIVQVKVEGTRPLILDDVVVRISPRFATHVHIDYDEASAYGLTKGARDYILE